MKLTYTRCVREAVGISRRAYRRAASCRVADRSSRQVTDVDVAVIGARCQRRSVLGDQAAVHLHIQCKHETRGDRSTQRRGVVTYRAAVMLERLVRV